MRSPRVAGLRRSGLVLSERIAESVVRAGGEPVLLVPGDAREAVERLQRFDGVLVPGGRDVDPAAYGEDARHPSTDEPDPVQDAADLALVRAVAETGQPLLAICRGMQLLNVALGGTLVQHLDDPDSLHSDAFHDVTLEPGSRLAEVMGDSRVRVSSYHHQAVGRLGLGLRVAGRSDDGCIEALAYGRAPVLAVQWHPEDDAHENNQQQALFDAFVDDARAATRKARATA